MKQDKATITNIDPKEKTYSLSDTSTSKTDSVPKEKTFSLLSDTSTSRTDSDLEEKTHSTLSDTNNYNLSDEASDVRSVDEALRVCGTGFGTLFQLLASYLLIARVAVETEVVVLVGGLLKCEWKLDDTQMVVVQSCGITAQLLSSLFCSNFGERWGRKNLILFGMCATTVGGVLVGTYSSSLGEFLVFRFIMGSVIGITAPSANIFPAEVAPRSWRTFAMAGTALAWGLGYTLTCTVAYVFQEGYGWRGVIVGSSLALSPGIIIVALARESPMFDLYRGNVEEAQKTIQFIARWNGTKITQHISLDDDYRLEKDEQHRGKSFKHIIQTLDKSGKSRDLAMILSLIATGVSVYMCIGYIGYGTPGFSSETSTICCRDITKYSLTERQLFDIGVVGVGEPALTILSAYIMERIGRRRANCIAGAVTFICLAGLYIPFSSMYVITLLIFLRRSSSWLAFIPLIMVREHFPTSIRSFCYHLAFGIERMASVLGILLTLHAYAAHPCAFAAVNQALLIAAMVVNHIFRVDTNLDDDDLQNESKSLLQKVRPYDDRPASPVFKCG